MKVDRIVKSSLCVSSVECRGRQIELSNLLCVFLRCSVGEGRSNCQIFSVCFFGGV